MRKFVLLLLIIIFFIMVGCVPTRSKTDYSLKTAYKPPEITSETVSQSTQPEQKETVQPTVKQTPKSTVNPIYSQVTNDNIATDMDDIEDENEKNVFNFFKAFNQTQPVLDEALEFCETAQNFWEKGELETALESLDRAYSLILRVDTQDMPKLIQQKDDLRFMISKRILEIYASRNIVVNGQHKEIPLTMNAHVQAEIDSFTKGREKKIFRKAYQRSGLYRPYIVKELIKAGLPTELSWIPLIESGFKTNALSPARALGIWQFIPSTGYKYGLKRTRYIDERMDPYKATGAAIAYLSALHRIFGEWSTVLAAYNCGEGRVLRTIRKQKVNYLDNFWDLYKRLPKETARYVPRFIATLHIVNNPRKYGLDTVTVDSPLEYKTVIVSRRIRLKDVARTIQSSENELKLLNPELRKRILPGSRYHLKVPPRKEQILMSQLNLIPMTSALPSRTYAKHRVKKGETLSSIARHYGVKIAKIARANRINKKSVLIMGRTLKIPYSKRVVTAKKKKTSTKAKKRPPIVKHTVKRGDSIWNIAQRYGSTVHAIRTRNSLRSTFLSVGQVLKVPTDQSVDTNASIVYNVRKGDSPIIIAKRFRMSLKRFMDINHLTPRSKIYPGQQVYVE
ncbi:LysM peptidoglycan-binding domain-containing protein [Desulfococcaceae bacterium HSG7]|nr:LysM peptidoglycan-binding domain-containing protein [Desulfococcaceae bacterium HSG7]